MSLKTGSRWSNWSWDKPVKAFIWRSSRICRPIGKLPLGFLEDSLPHLLLRNNSYEDSDSGGVDYFALPDGTMVNLFVELRTYARHYRDVLAELGRRGWSTNGRQLDGTVTRERAY